MNKNEILKQMTLKEKARLVSGHNFMFTNAIASVGLPAAECSDGPHGLRKQASGGDNGIEKSEPATSFPTSACTACGWDRENLKKVGKAIAQECRSYGVDVLLGPGVNIKRNPRCGRNFEYFSEDPYVAGELGSAFVEGVQGEGVGVSVKHFAANNNEEYRFMGNSVVDERALREIYLRAFEKIVRRTAPASLMCAYNQINGTFCSENAWLLTDVLRKEWGFDGIVMTDWGAVKDRVKGIVAGLDLEMPGDTYCTDEIVKAVREGRLEESALDECVLRMLDFVGKWHHDDKKACDFAAHHALAAEIAKDCAVLLKNEGVLPLDKEKKVLVAGEFFEKMRYQGAGSSMINPAYLTTPRDAFDEKGLPYAYAKGYREQSEAADETLIAEAVKGAKNYDTVLVFAGLSDYAESEGGDRPNMRLPENQLALIDALVAENKEIVVVLFGGSPVEMPFADKVSAILDMYLPGQNGGTATADLLYGDANPSGKLAETWAADYADVPYGGEFARRVNELYKESVFVGYRYYSTYGRNVRYPFGYGLSYTQFAYSDMQVGRCGKEITVQCKVKNVGSRDGAEVVQLYSENPACVLPRPKRELRAFGKVRLRAGEEKEVSLTFSEDDLRVYVPEQKRWALPGGTYRLCVAASSEDIRLADEIAVAGEKIAVDEKRYEAYRNGDAAHISDADFAALLGTSLPEDPSDFPITLETRLDRYQKTPGGKQIYDTLLKVANEMRLRAQSLPDGTEKDNLLKGAMFMTRIMSTNSARSLAMSSGPKLPYEAACAFVNIANGNYNGEARQ